jgi:hypothetical protein
VIGVVAVLPLVFSAVLLVAVPIVSAEGRSLSTLKDVNDDGMMDIVMPSGNVLISVGDNEFQSNEVVYTGKGFEMKKYAFSNGTLISLSNETVLSPSPLSFIDKNGDGTPENCIFMNYGELSMILYRNDGHGTYVPTKSVNIQADANSDYFAVVDFRELRRRFPSTNRV